MLDGKPLGGFDSDKTRALLAYLALESDRAHRRESLAALLWPNVQESSARQSLSQALSNLRRLLGDAQAATPFILATRDAVRFNPEGDYALDADRLATEPERYRPLLDGFSLPDAESFDEWLLLRRETLQRTALNALAALGRTALDKGDTNRAIELAHRQLAIDPWREEAHRDLMRALALAGMRNEAIAQYEKCKKILFDDVGVPPSSETTALVEQIKAGALNIMSDPAGPGKPPQDAMPLSPRRTALPAALTAFIGREHDLRALDELLENPAARLITVAGPGGMGKTRLAIEAARRAERAFADGAVFVPLAPVATPDQVPTAIAHAVGAALAPNADARAQILHACSQQQLLCVIDNIEHVLNGNDTVSLLTDMLQAAPQLKILITSREALGATGEWVYDLAGLGVDAHTLFEQAARRVRWQAAPDDAQHIADICRLVGGLPLAIELAASWLRTLSCAEIATEIARSLSFLATTARHVDERHRSITAVFDGSWRLLQESERRALEALSVFQGGFAREAAHDVADATLHTLSSLVTKSLLRRTGANRYDLHELVRQYAAEKLAASGRRDAVRKRHQAFYAQLAQHASDAWFRGERNAFVEQLPPENENLIAAVNTALEAGADAEARIAALRILWTAPLHWRSIGYLSTARMQMQTLLDTTDDLPPAVRGAALHAAGYMALWQSSPAQAQAHFEDSIRLLSDLPSEPLQRWTLASCLTGLGEVASQQNNYELALTRYKQGYDEFAALGDGWGMSEALIGIARHTLGDGTLPHRRDLLEQSVRLKRELRDSQGLSWALSWLSVFTHQMGELDVTEHLLSESLQLQERLGDKFSTAITLNRMAELKRQRGDLDNALRIYQQGLRLVEEIGIPASVAMTRNNMGYIHLAQGDAARAAALFKHSLGVFQASGDKEGMALALAGLGGVAVKTQRARFGAVCLSTAERLMSEINYYFESTDRVDFERHSAAARAALGESDFATAWTEGKSADAGEVARLAAVL